VSKIARWMSNICCAVGGFTIGDGLGGWLVTGRYVLAVDSHVFAVVMLHSAAVGLWMLAAMNDRSAWK
jgi:hypothetical protein